MKYFILPLGLFLTTNIGFAQETKRLTAEKHNEYGLILFAMKQAAFYNTLIWNR